MAAFTGGFRYIEGADILTVGGCKAGGRVDVEGLDVERDSGGAFEEGPSDVLEQEAKVAEIAASPTRAASVH